jgi:uncharacterized protein YdaU (DUF1376 family)
LESALKPPAFQFYADDFLAGTADMTAEEVGVFVRLLCHSWSKDGLVDDDHRLMLLAGQCQASSLAHAKTKFRITDGKLRNVRQEQERQKQADFRQKQAANGKKRWLGDAKPMPSLMPNTCSPSPSPSTKEPVHTQVDFAERPSWDEVKAHCAIIGLVEWRARVWFDEMEGSGWKDRHNRNVTQWRPLLNTVKTYWEADGRPMTPKGQHANNGTTNRIGVDRNAGTYNAGRSIEGLKAKVR